MRGVVGVIAALTATVVLATVSFALAVAYQTHVRRTHRDQLLAPSGGER